MTESAYDIYIYILVYIYIYMYIYIYVYIYILVYIYICIQIYIYITDSSPIWGFSIWELGPGLVNRNTHVAGTRSLFFVAACSPQQLLDHTHKSHIAIGLGWHCITAAFQKRIAKAIIGSQMRSKESFEHKPRSQVHGPRCTSVMQSTLKAKESI